MHLVLRRPLLPLGSLTTRVTPRRGGGGDPLSDMAVEARDFGILRESYTVSSHCPWPPRDRGAGHLGIWLWSGASVRHGRVACPLTVPWLSFPPLFRPAAYGLAGFSE